MSKRRLPGQEVGITIDGLDTVIDAFSAAANQVPAAIRYAINAAANELRDQARSNVPSSQYNLSHDAWGIKAIASKKSPFTALVGYYTNISDGCWHIKFYESGATRKNRGTIIGGNFLKSLHGSADSVAGRYMEESINQLLKDTGVN